MFWIVGGEELVRALVERHVAITGSALGQEVLESLSPTQQVVKVVRDELVELLGGEGSLRLEGEQLEESGLIIEASPPGRKGFAGSSKPYLVPTSFWSLVSATIAGTPR